MTPPSATPRTDAVHIARHPDRGVTDIRQSYEAMRRHAERLERELADRATPKPAQAKCDDPLCPCQDGDACHYEATATTHAMTKPAQAEPVAWVVAVEEADGMRVYGPKYTSAEEAQSDARLPLARGQHAEVWACYTAAPPAPAVQNAVPEVSGLVKSLRALSRHEHDDLSIGDEAADFITAQAEEPRVANQIIAGFNMKANGMLAFTCACRFGAGDVQMAECNHHKEERAAKEQAEAARLAVEREVAGLRKELAEKERHIRIARDRLVGCGSVLSAIDAAKCAQGGDK